jgi:hypothetical protein
MYVLYTRWGPDVSLYCLGNGLHHQRIGVQYRERVEIFLFSAEAKPTLIPTVDGVDMAVV